MTTIIEKFKPIKGSKTYYLSNEGNIKDTYKKYIYKFEKLKLNYSYSISIYKDISEHDINQWILEYTIMIESSRPDKILMRFFNIKDMIKYRRSSEEYNELKQYEPYENDKFDIEDYGYDSD